MITTNDIQKSLISLLDNEYKDKILTRDKYPLLDHIDCIVSSIDQIEKILTSITRYRAKNMMKKIENDHKPKKRYKDSKKSAIRGAESIILHLKDYFDINPYSKDLTALCSDFVNNPDKYEDHYNITGMTKKELAKELRSIFPDRTDEIENLIKDLQ